MFRFLFSTLIVLAMTPRAAGAQAATPAAPLTMAAAVAEAIARNPELAALRAEYEAQRAAPVQERYLMPPTLEAQIWAWPVTTLNPARTEMYMLTAEQDLPGRGKRAARELVADRDADLARQQIVVRSNEIVRDVTEAYVDLLFTRETFEVYARQAALLEELTETATLRYAAGVGLQHHSIVSLVDLARVERDRIAAEERAQAAEARLNTLIGRPAAQPVEPLAPVGAGAAVTDAEPLALRRHPALAMVDATAAREEAELARLHGERRPDFVVGGGYMLMPGDAGAWTARAGLTWPNAPWSRGRLTAAVDAQARRVEAARARRGSVASQLRLALREAVVTVTGAERQLRLIESTVLPQIEHAFELARLAYASGEGEYTEMLNARRMLLDTQLEQVEARAAVARARATLDALAGVL